MNKQKFRLYDIKAASDLTKLTLEQSCEIWVCDSISFIADQLANGVSIDVAARDWLEIASVAEQTYSKFPELCELGIFSSDNIEKAQPIHLVVSALESLKNTEIRRSAAWLEASCHESRLKAKEYKLDNEIDTLLALVGPLQRVGELEGELKLSLEENDLLLKQLHLCQDRVIEESRKCKEIELRAQEVQQADKIAKNYLRQLEQEISAREQQIIQSVAKIREQPSQLEPPQERFSFLKKMLGKKPKPLTKEKKDAYILSQSDLFDSNWYLSKYPDVADFKAGPVVHYVRCGYLEMRDPSPLFSTQSYLAKNPDVKESGQNPLIHYIKFGRAEGRQV
ncbi:hypothetical protein BFR57_02460 [Idiomarina sp. MD25a]|uniref:hypothetical protein n=1 Tax=Idiomarina sp. MD25a TaxID=1889913 RepID=UPI0008F90971|nr:hypothetical protein [Idiomarina sp. MD25a]OIM99447.1 hypothetical protein BFR57_02460 [Idiomarina sp. MD25a]